MSALPTRDTRRSAMAGADDVGACWLVIDPRLSLPWQQRLQVAQSSALGCVVTRGGSAGDIDSDARGLRPQRPGPCLR